MKAESNKRKKKAVPAFVFAGLCMLFGIMAFCLLCLYNKEGYERLKKDEECADLFIKELEENVTESAEVLPLTPGTKENDRDEDERSPHEKSEQKNEKIPIAAAMDEGRLVMDAGEPDFSDDNYYTGHDGTRYTPDFATGGLMFVLEYKKLKIRRGVYGTERGMP